METSYEITQQKEVIDLDGQGGPVRAMEVTFTSLPSDTVASVRVPLANYTAAKVGEAVRARVDVIEAVHQLGKA